MALVFEEEVTEIREKDFWTVLLEKGSQEFFDPVEEEFDQLESILAEYRNLWNQRDTMANLVPDKAHRYDEMFESTVTNNLEPLVKELLKGKVNFL